MAPRLSPREHDARNAHHAFRPSGHGNTTRSLDDPARSFSRDRHVKANQLSLPTETIIRARLQVPAMGQAALPMVGKRTQSGVRSCWVCGAGAWERPSGGNCESAGEVTVGYVSEKLLKLARRDQRKEIVRQKNIVSAKMQDRLLFCQVGGSKGSSDEDIAIVGGTVRVSAAAPPCPAGEDFLPVPNSQRRPPRDQKSRT